MGIFGNIMTPYRPIESWFYDRYISPALASWTPKLLKEIEPFMSELPENASVLDVGCGGGQLILHLAGACPKMRFTGIDLSKEQIARACRRTVQFGERTRFIQGSATSMPFQNNAFDLVISIGSLKHWPDRQKGLAECVRVLRPDRGLMICDAVRDVSKEEFENMAGSLPLPRLVRSLLKVMAAGPMIAQSPSMAEVRAWLEGLPISDIDARFVEGIPGMIAVARKKRMDG